MRLILHLGTHRTGTTSIQRFASRNRGALRDRGLWYPGYDLVGGAHHYAHLHLAHAIAEQDTSRLDYDGARRFFEEIRRNAGRDETVLISSEPLYRHTYPKVEETDEAYWEHRRRYIARVRDVIGDCETEALVVLRRQDGFAQSLYNEHVKTTRYTKGFRKFVAEKRPYFRYDEQLRLWREQFPSVRALVFDDLVSDGGIPGSFFRALGFDVTGLEASQTENVSLAHELVDYKRRMNGSSLSRRELQKLAQHIASPRFPQRAKLKKRKLHWLAAGELEEFLGSFEECNGQVLREFTSLERDTLFSDMTVEDRPAYRGLKPRHWRDITAAVLRAAIAEATKT